MQRPNFSRENLTVRSHIKCASTSHDRKIRHKSKIKIRNIPVLLLQSTSLLSNTENREKYKKTNRAVRFWRNFFLSTVSGWCNILSQFLLLTKKMWSYKDGRYWPWAVWVLGVVESCWSVEAGKFDKCWQRWLRLFKELEDKRWQRLWQEIQQHFPQTLKG